MHASEDVLPVRNVVKLEHDTVSMKEASLGLISTFSLVGVRKTRLEIGESAIVMGLGVLGIFAVQFLKAGGAVPVIAADPVEEKRKKALEMGADYALDPNAADFAARVKSLTYGRGADAAIEVSGVGAALVQVLECMAPMGRVALLGCTRNSNFTVDYYHCVHFPGVSLIGAHTLARPQYESSPHNRTTRDDVRAALALAGAGRISFEKMISEIHSPSECCEVYDRVINEKSFPSGVLFDWEHFEQNI